MVSRYFVGAMIGVTGACFAYLCYANQPSFIWSFLIGWNCFFVLDQSIKFILLDD